MKETIFDKTDKPTYIFEVFIRKTIFYYSWNCYQVWKATVYCHKPTIVFKDFIQCELKM